jgi:hypothetical protein
VASDTVGNFVVVWMSYGQDGSNSGVFGQRYASSGAALGPEFQVNTYTTSDQNRPAVASDSSGNFVVVWQSDTQDGAFSGIFGQRYGSSGAPLGPEFRVNTYTTSFQDFPSVAADASVNFVVVWQGQYQDGSNYGIFGQRYASSGVPLGPEFRVNTYTTSRQFAPVVASDTAGNFVVVWSSDTQDGSGYGVFGQRYSQIVPVEADALPGGVGASPGYGVLLIGGPGARRLALVGHPADRWLIVDDEGQIVAAADRIHGPVVVADAIRALRLYLRARPDALTHAAGRRSRARRGGLMAAMAGSRPPSTSLPFDGFASHGEPTAS